MDRQRIEEIVRIAQESPITELCVREGDLEVRVVKQSSHVAVDVGPEVTVASPNGVPNGQDPDPMIVIRADKVGFFHRGKGPATDPFVEVGDYVHSGQAVATLESLRKLTDITAPECGTVVRILADDGSAVEYGQPLMELRPKEGAENGAKR